jgi:hypothetical protein
VVQNFAFAPSPEIVAQPQSLIVTNGDSASFSVVATGMVCYVPMALNGTNITDATNIDLFDRQRPCG